MATTYYIEDSTKPLYRIVKAVWYILGLIEILLAFRFILRLAGANPAAGFTAFIYNITGWLVQPFINVFRITPVEGRVVEWTTLLAMVVYWLLAWAIVRLLLIGRPVSRPQASARLDQEDQ